MSQAFTLTIGQSHRWRSRSGHEYVLAIDTFETHDHKMKPLYYYYESQKPSDLVWTIETIRSVDDPPYPSPYAGTLSAGKQTVLRMNADITLFYEAGNTVRVEVRDTTNQSGIQ